MRLLLGLLFLLSLATSSSATYCLCKDGVGEKDLQTSIDYACGVLKDCNPIHDKGPCYQPNTVKSHCDWAVNTYFQRSGQIPGSCNFSGTATTSSNPPSTVVTGCIYPSSPGSAGTTPTIGTSSGTQTFPGTPVFGPAGSFDPSGSNNGASGLFISNSIALILGFSVIAFL
ncbi:PLASMODESMATA CALLOSE-BINDING PROTEIN 3 isoform X1 [Capsella rubella]|uniref:PLASMODESMATA CALLOSE-BINDING PROTEIN 3 isoform X1 n=1 Tax=Capsella rubella TaxID=81985 RepID=UPI000CD52FF0|nr:PLASMODESMATA CALLOSE-BINDING PROTEIN 3 isoform X1 [Capsella rubella]